MNDCVLIVDDEFLIADLLSAMIEDIGRRVCGTAATADEATALARQHEPALVLMDVRLKGPRDGIQAAVEIRRSVGSQIIFITGSREPATVARIQRDQPSAILFKPILFDQLKRAVEATLGGG